jgi:hypothetical protein
MRCVPLMLVLLLGIPAPAFPAGRAIADKVLFDFEDSAEVKAWSNLELPGARDKEPAAKIERSTDNATSGKHSLKITFAGGRWPTLTTTRVPGDWAAWQTFKADVTVSRRCVVGFTVLQEKSKRGGGWDAGVSRWCKTAFLDRGKNQITAPLRDSYGSTIRPEQGKVIRLEIFMYNPHEGESIYVDNIRLLAAKEASTPPARTQFKVPGTDLVVANVQELGKKLAGRWTRPAPQTVEQIEASFRGRFAELKKKHPQAVLAVFRDGDKGFDPAHPDKVYAGWKDAYWSSHGPDGLTVERGTNYGKHATQEVFMRHRSPLFRVDLSSIPRGSKILAATLLIVRAGEPGGKDHGTDRANMWVAEPCNRPWEEYEVNAYQYARDRFWSAVGGMHWGDDPDFLPFYVAHGPSQPGVSTWDFTHAVRFWTDGKHANHGFMLHGDSKDWFRAWFREARKVKDRPAVLVIYEPS